MRSTAVAYKDEFDEVPVGSTDVLEANVIAIREELKEHKTDFKDFRVETRAALARLDGQIKAAVAEMRAEIRAMAARAENDLRNYIVRADLQFSEMRKEHKELREKVDKIADDVSALGSKFNALFWALGGLVAFAGLAKKLGWI